MPRQDISAYRETAITRFSAQRSRATATQAQKAESASTLRAHMTDVAAILGSRAPHLAMLHASASLTLAKARQEGAIAKFVAFSDDIAKLNDEKRLVCGYASTTSLDVQGETITKEAMEDALPEYMKFANIREMHGNSAVGVVKSAVMKEAGLYIEAHVVDDNAWNKVKTGVYKGFSIGGKALKKAGGVISKMRLSEISLVDRPANPDCVIDAVKSIAANKRSAV